MNFECGFIFIDQIEFWIFSYSLYRNCKPYFRTQDCEHDKKIYRRPHTSNMDVHLSLNSESELGENYGFFTFPWFLTKNIDTTKQNMVTYVDNHVPVQKNMSTCICQKPIVKQTKKMVT